MLSLSQIIILPSHWFVKFAGIFTGLLNSLESLVTCNCCSHILAAGVLFDVDLQVLHWSATWEVVDCIRRNSALQAEMLHGSHKIVTHLLP